MNRLIYLKLVVISLLMPGCSESEHPDLLTPMQFHFFIDDSNHTRVMEEGTASSKWSDGDEIRITVQQGEYTETSTCTLSSDGSVRTYSNPLYWRNRAEKTIITAIYPCASSYPAAIDLADQSEGLAYVIKAYKEINPEDKFTTNPISLPFKHQLAKVRVTFTGDNAERIKVAKLKNVNTSCTIDKDWNIEDVNRKGYITMHKVGCTFEANVLPGSYNLSNLIYAGSIFEIKLDNTSVNFEANHKYQINIDAESTMTLEEAQNGHDAVCMREATDIQPALYVAKYNLGSESESDKGIYFWWGDTTGHPFPNDDAFNFSTDNPLILTAGKSVEELYAEGFITDPNIYATLTMKHDAARQQLGGKWRVPTDSELSWLFNKKYCKFTWQDSPAGLKIESLTTQGEIFLPITGKVETNVINESTSGYYWTSTPHDNPRMATRHSFGAEKRTYGPTYFYVGLQIRPVFTLPAKAE